MAIQFSSAIRLWLLCVVLAGQVSLLSGACVKAQRSTYFSLPGYITQPIHVNECRETTSSVLTPVVSLNATGLTHFHRTYSTCCCAVGNTSLHEVNMESLDGRPSILLLYRRIEECLCIACTGSKIITNPLFY